MPMPQGLTNKPDEVHILKGKRALVIGGSGGIGKSVAIELARRGASLIVHGGSSRKRLDRTLAELSALGAEASGFLFNIDRPSQIHELPAPLETIDLLVLAFGPFLTKSLAATTAEDWARLCLLNLALPGALASAVLPGMLERGWGRILFFGGTGTDRVRPYSTNAAYAAAKSGLSVLTKSIAAEGADRNIGCILVCPGFVDTEYLSDAQREYLRSIAPGARLLDAGGIARNAVDLLACDPCAASGAVISFDGGILH
jgi:3-oxoacyl-[acyl-carrier protein] reductase